MNNQLVTHEKSILLIEDLQDHYEMVTYSLVNEGYEVSHAVNKKDAIQLLNERHFHLAIVDVNLERNIDYDVLNDDGIQIIKYMDSKPELRNIASIVFTSYKSTDEKTQYLAESDAVIGYIPKTEGYLEKLIQKVHDYFATRVSINFELNYIVNSLSRVLSIAQYVHDNDNQLIDIPIENLIQQILDLHGKTFKRWDGLHVSHLTPGLTGASVAKIQPHRDGRPGQAYAVKIGRRDKMIHEDSRYLECVEGILSANSVTLADSEYTEHLGAISYSFGENDSGNILREFDEFYMNKSGEIIANSIERLFKVNCRPWYDDQQRATHYIPNLYYDAFQLTENRLHEAILEILPSYQIDKPYLYLSNHDFLTNPIWWLHHNDQECEIFVPMCITHGDLTGRNIMVDLDNEMTLRSTNSQTNRFHKFWLIDFYRTRRSHILRDLVVLETDIKYRLMNITSDEDFLYFDKRLLNHSNRAPQPEWSDDMKKAYHIIQRLRDIALYLLTSGTPKEKQNQIYISVLMGTLNVIRLRHIDKARKVLALKSASQLCDKLNSLLNISSNFPLPDFSGIDFETLDKQKNTLFSKENDQKSYTVPASDNPSETLLQNPIPRLKYSASFPQEALAEQSHKFSVCIRTDELKNISEHDTENLTKSADESSDGLKHDTSIWVVLKSDDLEFEPLSMEKTWRGDSLKFEFDFSPPSSLINQVAEINVFIRIFSLEIGRIENCLIKVINGNEIVSDSVEVQYSNPLARARFQSKTATTYSKIFVSYAREDSHIIKNYRDAQNALGHDVFVDTYSIRAGQDWEAALAHAIDKADIFQLFWSEHSAKSKYVKYEWDYALKYKCPDDKCRDFIRPVYWSNPMPNPPPELSHLHFAHVPFNLYGETLAYRHYNDSFWQRMAKLFREHNLTLRGDIRDLQEGQRQLYERLDRKNADAIERVLNAIDDNRFNLGLMQQMLRDIHQVMVIIQSRRLPALERHIISAAEDLSSIIDSNIGLQQKLEIALPIIPFFLDYKVELGTSTDIDLDEFAERLQKRWQILLEIGRNNHL